MSPQKRRSRLALSNWPVRFTVLAIVVLSFALAGALGGMRIYAGATAASELRGAAERADMVPAVADYLSALEDTMIATTDRGDTQAALTAFDARKNDLRQQLARAQVADGVQLAIDTLLDDGQDLLGRIIGNAGDLRTQVTAYAPLLNTAQAAITGLLFADDQSVRREGDAVSAAVATRGQMVMQRILVNRAGDLPEPELRTTMLTLAGGESLTASAMATSLGGASGQAASGSVPGVPDDWEAELRSGIAMRLQVMSDPTSVLVGNPTLLASQQITVDIADAVIAHTGDSIPAAVTQQADAARSAAIRDAAVVVAALVCSLVLVTLIARALVVPLRALRVGALKVAYNDLPREVDHVRSDGKSFPIQPIPVDNTGEIGQVAGAIDQIHRLAIQFACEQARMQIQVTDMLDTLSMRDQSLLDEQAVLIERLKRHDNEPERRESLLRLDHLAARMRRNTANLLVLAGSRKPREQDDAMSVAALVNAAVAEAASPARVGIEGLSEAWIAAAATGDLVHLLAELLDNALRYSAPTSQVTVSAVGTANGGLVIEIADTGEGMTESDVRLANARLQAGGEVNPNTARHLGLLVVGRLAAQNGIVVRLRSATTQESGATAGVYVPARLVTGERDAQPVRPAERLAVVRMR